MNIKKMVALVATGALAASLALFGCSSGDGQDSGAKDDKAAGNESGYTLVNDGKLTVAASLDFPPFENLNGDTPEGFEVELMGLLAEEMGLEINYLPSTKFDTIVPLIQTGGKADVGVSGITITDERLDQVDFTDAVCDVNQSITVLKDSGVTDVAQLEGKKVGAQTGTTGYEWAAENIKDVEMVGFDEMTAVFLALQSGQIDVAPTFPFSLAQGVESNEALALDIFPSTQIYYLTVNTTKPPFDDVKVRQALYYALNKSELASAIAGEYGTPVAAIVSETQGDWCNTDLQVTEYAPDTAKQMLADAGYTEPVELTLSIRTGSTFYEQIATLIKSEVDQAGFSCNIELLESATLTDKYSSQSHQATILQWVDDYQDPSGVVGWTVDYDQAQCFYTGLNDEELDALYMAAQTEMDHDTRVEMYRDIQQQVYDNANVIPLYRNDFAFARSAKVDGLQVNPFYVYQAMYWTKAN